MNNDPDKLLEARIEDMYELAERDYSYVYSSFLDERQCAVAEKLCQRLSVDGAIMYKLWGGYENAQRKMLCVYCEYSSEYIMQDYPIKCLTFKYRKEDKLSHRDFLGSFMGLRIKRETVGDIVVAEGEAQAFVTDTAARYIEQLLSKIGRVGVKISADEPFRLENEIKFKEISTTVASLRLDCITAAAANISREKAAALIRSEKTDVNHFTVTSASHELKEGDVLSVRGCGRFVLSGINGITKKSRIHIILKKYI